MRACNNKYIGSGWIWLGSLLDLDPFWKVDLFPVLRSFFWPGSGSGSDLRFIFQGSCKGLITSLLKKYLHAFYTNVTIM